MSIKIFLVLICSLWVVQCHVLSELHATQTAKATTLHQKEDFYHLMFPSAIKRKAMNIMDEKHRLRIRRQLKKDREGRGWSHDSYYDSYNSRPIRNNPNPNREVYMSSEQEGSASNHHNVNWDNIHIIEFNRARGRPSSSSQKSQNYGESEEKYGNRGYQNPNYEYDQSSDRRQSSSYSDNTEGSSFTNTRRNDEDDRQHGFTASLERHYESEHELEYSDHDIDEDKYSQRRHQVLPKPQSQYDQEYRPNYFEAF